LGILLIVSGGGGGIMNFGGTFNITNTIVADNTAATGPDLSGNFTTGIFNHNLIENSSGATLPTADPSNIVGFDPGLHPLDYNGSTTQTHALDRSSLAINRGSNAGAPSTDQRGVSRGVFVDIGAYEVADEPIALTIFVDENPTPIIINEGQSFINKGQSFDFSSFLDVAIALIGRQRGVENLRDRGELGWEIDGGFLDIALKDAYFDSESRTFRINLRTALLNQNFNQAISVAESLLTEEFLEEDEEIEEESVESIRDTLKTITQETGTHPVIVYAFSFPKQLELLVITPEDHIIHKVIPEAHADRLQKTVKEFRQTVTNPRRLKNYLKSSQQLYNWLIAPIESELEGLNVDTLIFSLDVGLRTIPLAALHDGERFLVEQYSLGVIPRVSLTNTNYTPLYDSPILAMGASEFSEQDPLPAVPVELSLITEQFVEGTAFLNQDFTFDNLKANARGSDRQILHLATHADFQLSHKGNAYIQLWDEKLEFDRLRELDWRQEDPVELLVLSACRTALGDLDAELGFAGLAVNTGAKSALASLWYVSDGGTLNLMEGFYRYLQDPDITIKAEALRWAQIAMIRGKRQGEKFWNAIAQSPEIAPASKSFLAGLSDRDFTHPYYWSAFTLVGSPW
ncbi:MAG: CHAT domain-containing protein, partial [Spirulina sp.]